MSFLARTHTRTELQYPYRDVCDRVSVHYCFSASCCSKRQRQVVQRCLLSLRLLYCCVTGNIHMLGDITFKWYGKRRSKVQSNKLSCCWHYESHLKKLSAELNNVLAGIRHYDKYDIMTCIKGDALWLSLFTTLYDIIQADHCALISFHVCVSCGEGKSCQE